jgi:hypothetical protein
MRPRCGVLFPCHGALPVEVGRRLVRAQILKHGAQVVAATDFLSRDRVAAVHIDEKLRVRGEEGHLALDAPAVCATSVRVGKLAYGKASAISCAVRSLCPNRCIAKVLGSVSLAVSVWTAPWFHFAVNGQAPACRRSARNIPMASSVCAAAFNFPTLPAYPCGIPVPTSTLASTPAAKALNICLAV